MSLLQKFFPTVAAVAATAAFALALGWYLYRYFSTARVSARPESRKGLSVWQAFLWVLAAFVVSRLLLWLGGLAGAWLNDSASAYLARPSVFWTRWDANHYVGLIRNWYVNTGDPRFHIVFFPLYPLLGRGLYLATGLEPEICAYLISNAAFLGCGMLMYLLAADTYGPGAGMRAMWLLMLSPLTLFCSLPYTESVFLLSTLAAVYAARRGKFFWVVCFGALSANARMCGMATAVPIFYELLRQSPRKDVKHFLFSALKVLPVSLGLLAYLGLNWQVTGDPFRFLTYQSEHWSQNFGSLWNTVEYTARNALEFHLFSYRIGVWIPQLIAIFLTLALFWAVWRRAYPGDMGYGLIYFYVSVAPTWLLSGPRYLTALYAVYPALAVLFRKKAAFALLAIAFGLLCLVSGGMFAGYGCIL